MLYNKTDRVAVRSCIGLPRIVLRYKGWLAPSWIEAVIFFFREGAVIEVCGHVTQCPPTCWKATVYNHAQMFTAIFGNESTLECLEFALPTGQMAK